MNIQHLPEEILLLIAKNLASLDLLLFSAACRCFRRICFPLYQNFSVLIPNPDLHSCLDTWINWKITDVKLDWNNFEKVSQYNGNHIRLLLKNARNVLIQNGKENWEEFLLPNLSTSCSTVDKVILQNCVCSIGTYQLEYKNTNFDIHFLQSKFVLNGQNECYPLTRLCGKGVFKVSDCSLVTQSINKIGFDFVNNILCNHHTACKNALTRLNLDGTLVNDHNLNHFIQKYPHLSHISLKNCQAISSTSLNMIGKISSLKCLSMSGNNEIKSLAALSACHSLMKLDVSGCKKLTDITGIMDLITNMEYLNLSGIPASLEILSVFYLDKLQELSVQNCFQVSDQLLSRMKMPKIKSLNVSSCVRLTGNTLKCLICNSEQMVSLNLCWLKKISVNFFEETMLLSRFFWRVEKLLLSNTNITDECLAVVQSCNPIFLKTLHLALCKNITDKGILKIALIGSLENLDISHLCEITDQSMNVIGRRLTRLKSLNFTGCNKLTDESVKSLSNCRYLSKLQCTQCALIHDHSIDHLSAHLPMLNEVSYVKNISLLQ